MATQEAEYTLMVHKTQETVMVYEAGHESQAKNNADIMSANTETLENEIDNRNGPRSNYCKLRPCCTPSYNNLSLNTVSSESGDELIHHADTSLCQERT